MRVIVSYVCLFLIGVLSGNQNSLSWWSKALLDLTDATLKGAYLIIAKISTAALS